MNPAFTYSVFGLQLRSNVPLPDLTPSKPEREADAEIRSGSIPVELGTSPGHAVTAEGTLINVPQVGRYLIRNGHEITFEPDPAASEPNVRLYLLGSAMGVLLHQRGLLPLHANAIEFDGRAVAFSGHSGAGKSTMAAWFHDRGFKILTDDVCVVDFDNSGRAIAYPGIPRLRLWRAALEASGRTSDGYQRSFDDMDKYDVPTHSAAPAEPLPLDAVYLLRKAPPGIEAAEVRRLLGVEAVDALVSNTYRGAYLHTIGRTGEHLMTCLKLAKAVPIFSAERLWGFDQFEEQAKLLEAHIRSLERKEPL